MPVWWSIQPSQQRVLLVVSNPYSYEQWMATVVRMLAHREFRPGLSFLIDYRDASPPPPGYVRSQVQFLDEHAGQFGTVRAARLVRLGEPGAYGMARMLEMLLEFTNPSFLVNTFDDRDLAVQWLDAADRS